MRPRHAYLVAAALLSATSGRAWAQAAQPAAVVPSPPPRPPANEPLSDFTEPRLIERTALTLDGGELALGILAFAYGITDRVMVGMDPPYWFVRALTTVLVPNLNLRVAVVRTRDLWISANVAAYYAFVGNSDLAKGQVLSVPLSGFVSYQAMPGFWIHPELTYTVVNAFGEGDFTKMTLGGTAATRTVQLGLLLQYQLTSVFGLTLVGRYQPYTGRLAVSGSGSIDQFTTANVDARVTPSFEHPWEFIAGVAFLWQHVRLTLGVGYGNYFLPGMDVAIRGLGFVPDGSLMFVL